MNLGEVNKGAIALILVLLLGAGGYLWYSMMYKPAVAQQAAAVAAEKTAQDTLAAAKSRLAAAEQQLQDSKKASAAPDDSVARLQLARKAVPEKKLIDDAAIVLMDLARRADIRTSFKVGGEGAEVSAAPDAGAVNGAVPVDLTFKAAGSYREMMLFMSYVEDTVAAEDGKIHARDRLFNVIKLEIGEEEEDASGGGFTEEGSSGDDPNELVARNGEILFTVTVRMYTSSTANASSVGTTTPDPAAAPSADGTGGAAPAAGDATTPTDPAAGGATTPTDPAAGGAVQGTTDPQAAVPASGGGV